MSIPFASQLTPRLRSKNIVRVSKARCRMVPGKAHRELFQVTLNFK